MFTMIIVADTNIFLCTVLGEPERERVIEHTRGAEIIAPEILPYELGNALSAMVKRKRLTGQEALQAEALARSIPVQLVNIDIAAALAIAIRHSLYAYDAYFLQCALALSAPLMTLDQRMRQVAGDIGISILE